MTLYCFFFFCFFVFLLLLKKKKMFCVPKLLLGMISLFFLGFLSISQSMWLE